MKYICRGWERKSPARSTARRASAGSAPTSPTPTASIPWASPGATRTATPGPTPGAASATPPSAASPPDSPSTRGTRPADSRRSARGAGTSRSSPFTTWPRSPGPERPSASLLRLAARPEERLEELRAALSEHALDDRDAVVESLLVDDVEDRPAGAGDRVVRAVDNPR